MKRSFLAVTGMVCLLPGVLVMGGWAQDSAGQAKRDWSRNLTAVRLVRFADIGTDVPLGSPYHALPSAVGRVPNLRIMGFAQGSFFPVPRPFAVRPLARPATADAWNAASGDWSVAGNWTAGVPNSSSAVTIGNTSSVTVTEDLASASAASLSITSGNELYIAAGNTLTVGGTTTVSSGSQLDVGNGGSGGATLNSGSLTNNGYMQIGSQYNGTAATATVTGTYTGTGATLVVQGGDVSGSNSLLNVSGAAPATLTGTYEIQSSTGSAAVEWGSGAITSIGDGVSNAGYVSLVGSSAYAETGATNSDSALKTLGTIASNGQLYLDNGATMATTVALTNHGVLGVGSDDNGGSTLTLGGSLTNTYVVQVGNQYMASPSMIDVTGTLTNTGGTVRVYGGDETGSNSLLKMTGAAPGTLTGTYEVQTFNGSAAIEWGSGAITSIGDGVSDAGYLSLVGSTAYAEIGATNSDSALKMLGTIASNGQFYLDNGATMTTTVALTNNGVLGVGSNDNGGSTLTLGGSLTNTYLVQVGSQYMGSPSAIDVTGTLTNTGGTVRVYGGDETGSNSLLNISGAAPGTLTGTYQAQSFTGSAAIEWGSGAITSIGDGASNAGYLSVVGSAAYAEIGATNSDSALKTLGTIASNGQLYLDNGATMTTTVPLTNNGVLGVGSNDNGGSTLTLGGSLTNTNLVQVGSQYMASPSIIDVTGMLTNTDGTVRVYGGDETGSNSLLKMTGAAPGTLTGTYQVQSFTGSAAIEWGSGAITSIGDGVSNAGYLSLLGSAASAEVGATNSDSALKTLGTIASNGQFYLDDGATMTTTVAMTNKGILGVGNDDNGGSTLTLGGSLTNTNTVQVGNEYMVSPSSIDVTGTLTNTGATVGVYGGDEAGANSLLKMTGAAPTTLTGTYNLQSKTGSAAIEWGSGAITSIGNGASSAGEVTLSGASAYMEIGATNTNSALKSLTTIASNGQLQLENGASVTDTAALTVANGGVLGVDAYDTGGSILRLGGALTNSGSMQIGNYNMSSLSTIALGKDFTNTSTGTVNIDAAGANLANANAVLEVTGPSLVNSGAINLNGSTGDAELEINGNVTLSGAGKVNLSNIATNIITGAATTDTLTNSSTIQGSGTFENIGIVNTGTITANQSTPIVFLPSSLGLNNQGTLSVLTGDTMEIGTSAGGALTNFSGTTLTGGTYSVGGTLQFGASGASIVTDAANISLTGVGAQMINFGNTSLLTNLATITSAGSLTLGASWGTFTTTGNFTNDGTLSVGSGDKFIVDLSDSLTNFSGTTLTGGTYKVTGTLEFAGADIVTNDAAITLTGASSKIVNQTGTNALANLATNAAGASFVLGSKRSFTTAGNFTNNGYLSIAAGDTFDVNGNLTNFSGTTLTGGTYSVSGILEFDGADIVTNAANITLGSATAKIENQSAANALLGFTTNTSTGKFTLSGDANLTTTAASFSNAGTVTVSTGSTFTIGGSNSTYTQTKGTTTVDGTLAGAGASTLDLTGGNLYGTGTVNDGVTDAATITPGNSATSTGKLQVDGTYAQNTGGALDVTIGGTTAGTKFDQLNVSGAASLNGTLNITLASGYTPAIGNTFDILNASSVSGSFSTVNGVAINSSEHFTVTEVSGDEIVLTVVSGAATTNSVSLAPLIHPGVVHGRYGREVFSSRSWLATVTSVPRTTPPAFAGTSLVTAHGFRPRDDFGSPEAPLAPLGAANAGLAGSLGISPVSAAAYNSMAAMNHMRFECGVDLKALLKTSRKQLLRGLWAAPDSPDAINIGYMTLTTR